MKDFCDAFAEFCYPDAFLCDVLPIVERLNDVGSSGFGADSLFFHLFEETAGVVAGSWLGELVFMAHFVYFDFFAFLDVWKQNFIKTNIWLVEIHPSFLENFVPT